MSNDSFILEGVVITAKRPDYQIKDGNLVTRIENSLLSKSGTGNDVLKHIPGIQEKKENSQYLVRAHQLSTSMAEKYVTFPNLTG